MTTRSRRQTRHRRTTPYYAWPDVHNDSVRHRKEISRAANRHAQLAHHIAVIARALADSTGKTANHIREAELQEQIAWADLMSTRGFDMRDEHDALERGEFID